MFGEGTPFDLQMHLFRIPIRVIPTFWIMAAVLGWDPDRFDLVFLWVMCVFGSVLFHELGHALIAEAFGYQPHIVLHHFGGYAAFQPGRDWSPFRSLMITLAGPLPQFFLGVVILVATPFLLEYLRGHLDERPYEYVARTMWYLVWINVGWSLMNLLPVLPLDGGQATRAILEGIGLRDGHGIAMKISIGVGALVAAGMFQMGMQMTAMMFLLLTVQNLQELQARRW